MMQTTQTPPRWADALLRSLLRPSDREAISGDLLEEYRAAKRPAIGAFRANAWYVKHVLSVLWHLAWPWLMAIAAVQVFLLAPSRPDIKMAFDGWWNASLVPAPAISIVDCAIYLLAACYCAQRTQLARTGILIGGIMSVLAWAVVFGGLAVKQSALVAATFANPFIFAILGAYALVAVGHGVALGAVGGVIGRWRRAPLFTTF